MQTSSEGGEEMADPVRGAARRAGTGAISLMGVLALLAGASDGVGAALPPTPAAALAMPAPAVARAPSSPLAVPPWSQGVHYRIEASLDEDTDVLSGMAGITYTNNSPDTLRHFYVHQHLNAFRPNSAWARADLERGIRTFQDLGPEEHAYERIQQAFVEGRRVEPFYPHAPDSTVAGFELPDPLGPGETITLAIRWDARLSTLPRRQGRRGRHFDFAQWYPRVVVYDLEGWRTHPLYRQGEFYGEFATYDVTVQVAEDQVVAATGVPLEGDPGWADAAVPGTGEIDYQRDWYGSLDGPPCIERAGVRTCGIPGPPGAGPGQAESLDLLEERPATGFKQIRWFAEGVHHFAWTTSPDYIYEQGRFEDVPIRVLYRPGDEEEWGGGTAVQRTAVAMEWMDTVFGDYVWPQITNVHRIEPGGTEFPMVIMDGSASLGLIVHEINHQYVHGILGNNEWYEGWLDEGFSSFLESWFFEERGAGRSVWLGTEAGVVDLDLRGASEPVVLPAEEYPDYATYGAMVYSKGSLILRMLRDLAGDEAMVEILRTYYDRYRLRHVDSDAFQAVAEEVLRRDLDWFFGQWLHGTGVVDYALSDVDVDEAAPRAGAAGAGPDADPAAADGSPYRTAFAVERLGEMIMPLPVRLTGEEGQVKDTVVSGWPREARHTVGTVFQPTRVELDADGTIVDWNGLNDVWVEGLFRGGGVERSLLRPLGRLQAYRDRMAAGYLPLVWWNEPGGVVGGIQRRTGYMGSLHRSVLRVGAPAVEALGRGGTGDTRHDDPGSVYFRIEDPIVLDRPRFGVELELFAGEGRMFGRAARAWELGSVGPGPRRTVEGYLLASDVYEPAYLIPGRWSTVEGRAEGTSAEAGIAVRSVRSAGTGTLTLVLGGGAGISTRAQSWGRGSVETRWIGGTDGWVPSLRLFGGLASGSVSGGDGSGAAVPRQRRFGVSGAGPLESLRDPWARSRGSALDREAHHPGDGNLRGFSRELMTDALVTLGGELRSPTTAVGPLEVAGILFGGAGWLPELVSREGGGFRDGQIGDVVVDIQVDPLVADAGVGVELGWAGSPLALRVDLPVVVSHEDFARSATEEPVGFRWAVSVVSR